MDNWRYYRRTGGGATVFEVCRFPVLDQDVKDLHNQDWSKYPEFLQPNGSWKCYPDDDSIYRERLFGNFDEEIDEITEEQVAALYAKWSSERWPGRA